MKIKINRDAIFNENIIPCLEKNNPIASQEESTNKTLIRCHDEPEESYTSFEEEATTDLDEDQEAQADNNVPQEEIET